MTDILAMTPAELADFVRELGEAPYRAKQLFAWLHSVRNTGAFADCTVLSKPLREKLSETCEINIPREARRQVSSDGTVKYLWEYGDGQAVESVFMSYEHGNTVCLSTQAGCRMGCAFCASTRGGKIRDLTAGEIEGELLAVARDAETMRTSDVTPGAEKSGGHMIHGFVLMGTGEPLDNTDNVLRFLALASDPAGLGIGMRHVSLSTCGLCDEIDRLAEKKLQLTLSISLHAATDEKRDLIMPVNKKYPIAQLMRSCRSYFDKTGRRISFEYAMIRGFNDTRADADALISLLRGTGSHVNLIPLNEIDESPYKPSRREDVESFVARLGEAGITATVRRKLGRDIDAACGQLRRRSAAK